MSESEVKALRDQVGRLKAALEVLLDYAKSYDDAGPRNEGWQSSGLQVAIAVAETELATGK